MNNEREHFTGAVIGFNIYTNANDTKQVNHTIPLKPELLNPTKTGLLRPSRSCKPISEGKTFNTINNYLKYRTA